MTSTLVIIPTYNEKENIGTLIDQIFEQPAEVDVLVVDDGSPDGTSEIVRDRQNRFGERLMLKIRTEGKAGRGSACMYGFNFALENGYESAIEMDADLSHDSADIPRMVEKLSGGADVVVGSKYVKGGKVVGWQWYRKLLSRGANIYAGLILRIPINDFTNGYRLYGPRALKMIPELKIDGVGFTVIPQMSYQLYKAGMEFSEIPITFTNRREGKSNMSLREMTESFVAILKIRF
ncbi:polyprenol monophosphomannose synthase [Patescibacteria group bacterium]|nr:polyprenol monophosphomannose synthase [Patescibacteria group bacterium]MBU1122983.1 polyprenol monophosphomannose synthase [Patescibacteria group bacterium]MBU1911638.1 polyprenol monophosphomannose synthase [Patescibacteria group bacterium]